MTAYARPPRIGPNSCPILGETAALQHRAHESEKRNREQQIVGQDAEDALRQRLQQGELKVPELDADHTEKQAHRGERERDRIADEHEDHEPAEHERAHDVPRDHCSGLS
jgi:hypothetical protein